MDIGLKVDCNSVDADDGYMLTAQQYKAIEMLIDGGFSKTKIAEELGINRRTISRWCKDERFMAELQECADETKRQTINYINSKALLAAKKYWALTDSGDTRTKCAVLQDWLNRSVGKPNSKVELTDNREVQEDYDIQAAMERLNEDSSVIIPMRKEA